MINFFSDDDIEIFIRSYRDYLKNEGLFKVSNFFSLYRKINSSLHLKVNKDEIDFATFTYCFLRLPKIIYKVKRVVLAQTDEIFFREGYKIAFWQEVDAAARRRKMVFDGEETLGVFINSVTDVDDLVCLLTAYQIEWNKINQKIEKLKLETKKTNLKAIKEKLKINDEDWLRLEKIWKKDSFRWWQLLEKVNLDFSIKLLRGSYVDYKKATQKWFDNILKKTQYNNFSSAPLYFISSNTHSLVNVITRWVNQYESILINYLKEKRLDDLLKYWQVISKENHKGSKENFLWYVLKKFEVDHPDFKKKRKEYELSIGIDYIPADHYLDINAQIINLKKLGQEKKIGFLKKSDAFIINIDYPLGFGAYMVLSTVLDNVNCLKGVYILGKASFLNGNLGDIGLPNFVYDTHSKNSFIIKNAFSPRSFYDHFKGSILNNQKVISVKGTFLQTEKMLNEYFREGFNIVEMENGPYLNALSEIDNYHRYPEGKLINLTRIPLDLGIIHYASDNPFTKAITLGTRNLGYEGVDATYNSSLIIFRRVLELERERV